MTTLNAKCPFGCHQFPDMDSKCPSCKMVQAVKDHAKAHYNEGGWDMVVECYEDSEILEAIAGCTTSEEAIARLGEVAGVYHDRRLDAWHAGGLDDNGNLPAEKEEVEDFSQDFSHNEYGGDHDAHYEDELTGWEEHERDEYRPGSEYEYCPRHPSQVISNGMFDGICGQCEGEADDYSDYLTFKEELAASGPICTDAGFKPWRQGRNCNDQFQTMCYTSQEECTADNEIPF